MPQKRIVVDLNYDDFNDRLLDTLDQYTWFTKARDSRNAFEKEPYCEACGKFLREGTGTTILLQGGKKVRLGPKCSKVLPDLIDATESEKTAATRLAARFLATR